MARDNFGFLGLKKLVLILGLYIFTFVENWYNMILDIILRTGSNPQDINWFRMNTRNRLMEIMSLR